MNRGITDFTLKLLFVDWRLSNAMYLGLGIGAAVIAHLGLDHWPARNTVALISFMLVLTIVSRCIAFAYKFYRVQFPRLQALRYVRGEGLSHGELIMVFSPWEGAVKGQLVTLFCESSGACQPILIAEISSVSSSEIQAVPIVSTADQEIRKYFEEESRRKMLFATPEVTAQNLLTQGFGGRDD